MAVNHLSWIRDSVLAVVLIVLSVGDVMRFFFSKAEDPAPPSSELPNDLVIKWASPGVAKKAVAALHSKAARENKKKSLAHAATLAAKGGADGSDGDSVASDVGATAGAEICSIDEIIRLVSLRFTSPSSGLFVQVVDQDGKPAETGSGAPGANAPADGEDGETKADVPATHAAADASTRELLLGVTTTEERLGRIAEAIAMYRTVKPEEGGGSRAFTWAQRDMFVRKGAPPPVAKPADGELPTKDAIHAATRPPPMFSSGERVRLVWSVMRRHTVGKRLGRLLQVPASKPLMKTLKQSGIIANYFAVHCHTEKQALEIGWVRTLRSQPIEAIKDYMGEKVAMYFSFIGSYTSGLVLPAAAGILAHMLQVKHGMAGRATILYSMFIMTWSTVFLERWKRTQSRNAFRWNTLDFHLEEESAVAEFVKHPGTGEWVSRAGSVAWWYRRIVSPAVVLFMIGISCLAMYFTEVFTEYIRLVFDDTNDTHANVKAWVDTLPEYAQVVIPHSPLLVYAASIPALDSLFTMVAHKLTALEERETRTRKHNSLIVKLVLFQFWNNFMSLFYLAFALRDLDRLRQRLGVLLVVRQVIDNLLEVGLPIVMSRLRVSRTSRSSKSTANVDAAALNQECVEAQLEPYEDTFDDMLELFIQYGHVTLFAAAFPLAAVCAMLNNVMEIRSDAYKVCSVQRPIPHRCASIGSWLTAFEALGYVAVITNCALIALATDNLGSYLPSLDLAARVMVLVVLEHVLVAAKLLLDNVIPDVPADVRLALQLISDGNTDDKDALLAKVSAGAGGDGSAGTASLAGAFLGRSAGHRAGGDSGDSDSDDGAAQASLVSAAQAFASSGMRHRARGRRETVGLSLAPAAGASGGGFVDAAAAPTVDCPTCHTAVPIPASASHQARHASLSGVRIPRNPSLLPGSGQSAGLAAAAKGADAAAKAGEDSVEALLPVVARRMALQRRAACQAAWLSRLVAVVLFLLVAVVALLLRTWPAGCCAGTGRAVCSHAALLWLACACAVAFVVRPAALVEACTPHPNATTVGDVADAAGSIPGTDGVSAGPAIEVVGEATSHVGSSGGQESAPATPPEPPSWPTLDQWAPRFCHAVLQRKPWRLTV